MKKPVLIIMAAGMGSRYGGLKQIDSIDDSGHLIIDYSLFDAKRAGFETVIFVIRPDIESDFRKAIGDRISRHMDVRYVHQLLTDIPKGFTVPYGRAKPWGTAQAVMSARQIVNSPFAVINADDYYGQGAMGIIYDFLSGTRQANEHAMVGYSIENTLTENGYVSRGICQTDNNNNLTRIVERINIKKTSNGARYLDDNNEEKFIPNGTIVSMNLWGFDLSMMDELVSGFPAFLKKNLASNPLKCEYFLPSVINQLIEQNKASVKVYKTNEEWHGITYPEDKAAVYSAIKDMKAANKYPEYLWEDCIC